MATWKFMWGDDHGDGEQNPPSAELSVRAGVFGRRRRLATGRDRVGLSGLRIQLFYQLQRGANDEGASFTLRSPRFSLEPFGFTPEWQAQIPDK